MTVTKKRFLVLISALVMALSFSLLACSGGNTSKSSSSADNSTAYELINEGKLTVASELDFPPYESFEEGQEKGFSIELMALLAEEMGCELEYLSPVEADTIVSMITTGTRADVGASSFIVSDELSSGVDFTNSYCAADQGILVMKGSNYSGAEDLEGKKVGVKAGSVGQSWAAENIRSAEVLAFEEMPALFATLQSGQIDGIVIDVPVAHYYTKDLYQDVSIVQEIPTGSYYALMVNKGNPKLTQALNTALEAIKSNGKYDELYAKWFG
ncbi:MAG: ABC transporter substrate-binding protein [Raoultibacter sp.]|jgi:polar amino acid transport system substrate-binding protein